jgi:NAD(P)-dependent dehydrogenase (short-subunit alcohol dehydrogenase family)
LSDRVGPGLRAERDDAGAGLRALAAVLVGLALGAMAAGGTALLLYTGSGFLKAAGLLVSSTIMAVAAGLWAGAPDGSGAPVRTRGRWIAAIASMLIGGFFAALWSGREPLRALAIGGALAVLLVLALPAYAAGSLLAGLHARDRARLPRLAPGGVAAGATAGAALGVLLGTTVLIQTLEPFGVYYAAAAVLSFASLLDWRPGPRPLRNGGPEMVGHIVLITGVGARGQLGFAVARRFLDAGARVVITSRSDAAESLAAELGDGVLGVRADLLVDDDVARLFDIVAERFGRLDALINIAGGLTVSGSIEQTSADDWQREGERNAGTALRTSRAALPLLRAARGAIVNFAAPAGERAVARLGAYSAAKAAVLALTRALALEEQQHGVRVNAIAPGIMDTEQNRSTVGGTPLIPLDDVADVVLFLAGPESRAITGETVHVPGSRLT